MSPAAAAANRPTSALASSSPARANANSSRWIASARRSRRAEELSSAFEFAVAAGLFQAIVPIGGPEARVCIVKRFHHIHDNSAADISRCLNERGVFLGRAVLLYKFAAA